MNFKLAGIGEVLWDLLPGGKQLGGAPANFAYHARALGAEGDIVSRVGRDPLGLEIIERLRSLGLPTEYIEIDETKPTGAVSIKVLSDGQPEFMINEDVAWDYISGGIKTRHLLSQADAVCFGTLAQRSPVFQATLATLLTSVRERSLKILDVNFRQEFYSHPILIDSLIFASMVKMNDLELPVIADMFDIEGGIREQMERLAYLFDLDAVACTRGGQGSLIFVKDSERWSEHPGIPTKVADTVGAGDAFTAAMALGWLNKWDLDRINETANKVASYVASQPGATPILPEELRSLFK